ncbi:carboxylesterase family protein, partial [Parvibaculum sp.]|uniref:carboxylesterase family protein n=1 Tax=Parvibaculum sp. TaxID=2024848 RepID=UPI002C7C6A3A
MRAVAILAISAAAGAAFFMPGLMRGGGAMAQDDTIVRVETGALQGTAANGIFSFKNIPYAAPPVGNLRWRAPQPAAHWDGVRSATAYGNDCIQNRFMF